MQKCPQCQLSVAADSMKFCPVDGCALEQDLSFNETQINTSQLPPASQTGHTSQTVAAKYVFLDIVGFTRNRSIEAQSYIVLVLNEIVKLSVHECGILPEQLIYIPTGDGICIAIINHEDPFDIHLQLAAYIIEELQKYNDAIEKGSHKFQVRIGINANTDNLIIDINGNRNIAGTGISNAARIMDKADASQILVGRTVYENLRHRELYLEAFRPYRVAVKHGIELTVYQFISERCVGLNTDQPQSVITDQPKSVTTNIPESRRIVVVIPALAQNGWFAELIQGTFRQLHHYDFDVILKIPYEDFSKAEQKNIFEHLRRHPDKYVGGIIVIFKHDQIQEELIELCNELSYPIIFADVRPFDSENDYPANTAFVGYDGEQIGESAAWRVKKHLEQIGKDKPIVKVICSANSQTKRQDAFCAKLKALVENVQIDVHREGEFQRARAKAIAMKLFAESIDNGEYIDAIFCTNDEMALGVYDAMLSAKYVGPIHPFLIGVDGTKGALRLIQDKDAFFDATIEQSTKDLSQKIVALLYQKINKESCSTETSLFAKVYDKEIARAEGGHH